MDKKEWEIRTTKIGKMIRVTQEDVFKELPMQHLAIIQLVAERPGISQPEISETLNMSQGATSRNVNKLGVKVGTDRKTGRIRDAGYGLIKIRPDTHESRRNACFLSQKGERFWERLLSQF